MRKEAISIIKAKDVLVSAACQSFIVPQLNEFANKECGRDWRDLTITEQAAIAIKYRGIEAGDYKEA